jgi:site-specific recombinase XerD
MRRAGIEGSHASPKGLRHGFGVACVQSGIPASLLKKWLGHTNVANTLIYSDLVGEDEVAKARRLW